MANTYTRVHLTNMGDMRFSIYEVTGDGSTTSIANTDVGMHRFQAAWLQDIDDAATLQLVVTSATELTLSAGIGNTQKQMLFCIGY